MWMVAIITGHQAFPDGMMRSALNLGFHFQMAAGAYLIHHCKFELKFVRLGRMNGVTSRASQPTHLMNTALPICLLARFMTGQTNFSRGPGIHRFKTFDEGYVTTAIYVG